MTPRDEEAPRERAGRPSGRWVPIAQEPDQLSAEIVVNFLRLAAIPVRTDARDTMSFLGPSNLPTRLPTDKSSGGQYTRDLGKIYENKRP